jgi:hypothetical protein
VEPARMEKVFKRWTEAQLASKHLARHVKG